MHALVVEAVVRRPEELLEGRARIERRVVLAGHEANLAGFEAADQLAELRETPAPLARIVGGVAIRAAREARGKHDSAQSCELQKLPPIDLHAGLRVVVPDARPAGTPV